MNSAGDGFIKECHALLNTMPNPCSGKLVWSWWTSIVSCNSHVSIQQFKYIQISLVREIGRHCFIKWLIHFPYIKKLMTEHLLLQTLYKKNVAFSRGLQPILNTNETKVALLWKPRRAQAKCHFLYFHKSTSGCVCNTPS